MKFRTDKYFEITLFFSKKFTAIIVILILLSLCACSSGSGISDKSMNNSEAYGSAPKMAEDMDYAESISGSNYGMNYLSLKSDSEAISEDAQNTDTSSYTDNRKIIRNSDVTMETLEFDKAVDMINKSVEEFGGYIISSNVEGTGINYSGYSYRTAGFTIRIPASKLDTYLLQAGNIGHITSNYIYSDDITTQYYDSETRMKSMLVQEERIIAILEKATDLESVLEIERELASIRYEIESIQSLLIKWDNQVRYSTVNITLREVQTLQKIEETPITLSQRISSAFQRSIDDLVDGFQDFVVFIAGSFIGLIIWAIIITVVVVVVVKIRHKRKLNKAESTLQKKDDNAE